MREIKFRGMGIDGTWHYGLLAHTENSRVCPDLGWFISNKVGAPFAYQVRPETVGQFTGLKDKNGKEIYEGDIIRYGADSPSKIFFEEGSFKWTRNITLGETEQIKIEVIGNTYENPELLTRKDS